MERSKLIDAQMMARIYPKTFEAPSESELQSIEIGDSIKVSADGERFWVQVTDVVLNDRYIVGFVDNDLILSDAHGYRYEDKIRVEFNEVYAILK